MADFLTWLGVGLLAASVCLWAWRRWAPVSFWYVLGFPFKVVRVYGTWRAVASGCGLSKRRRRWRWSVPGFPGWGAE
jgi:S-DNA-T family DNA segregation ATPase FtsK/SpoIIIE